MKKLDFYQICYFYFIGIVLLFAAGCGDKQQIGGETGETLEDGYTMTIDGIECVLVKAGTFTMGSPISEEGRDDNETQHEVTLTKDFWISKYEITNAQYEGLGNANHPYTWVSWTAANNWAKSKGGRLPTEAEWEFAARGGNKSKGYIYSGSDNLDEVGWYYGNSDTIHPIGEKQPNELGIYDMSGNVSEWCGDFSGGVYSTGAVTDPTGPETGYNHIIRGGSWRYTSAHYCRIARRADYIPFDNSSSLGFRVVFPRD